jgi:hypothetical protein
VTKKFGVNRTLRYGTAVHGYVLPMLASTELVYNLGKSFLTHPTLTGYQHGKVGRRHLHGNINGTVQFYRIANDAKTKLDVLYICLYHSLIENYDKITNKSA